MIRDARDRSISCRTAGDWANAHERASGARKSADKLEPRLRSTHTSTHNGSSQSTPRSLSSIELAKLTPFVMQPVTPSFRRVIQNFKAVGLRRAHPPFSSAVSRSLAGSLMDLFILQRRGVTCSTLATPRRASLLARTSESSLLRSGLAPPDAGQAGPAKAEADCKRSQSMAD